MSTLPETKFVRSGGVDIAYQVVGDGVGDLDLVVVPAWISHCELSWELPEFARFLQRFTEYSRLIVLDKRGTGMSDRVTGPPTLEEHVEDLRAVLDAAGADRPAIAGWGDGGAVAILFAATYPDRVRALVLSAVVAKVQGDPTVDSWGVDPDVLEQIAGAVESNWGEGLFQALWAPSMAGDPRFSAWWRRRERLSVTPNAAGSFFRFMLEIDVRAALPAVRAPTLVIHRREMPLVNAAAVRWLAGQIPGAQYVELPGGDALPYLGDADSVSDEIEQFLTGASGGAAVSRVLATVLFVDISGSTPLAESLGDQRWQDLLEEYQRQVRLRLTRFRGEEVASAGDGFLATFDGPARAVRCALAIGETARELGMEVHAGAHTGEIERRGGEISGVAVHVGARVGSLAQAGEVLVTSTVKDLVIGSGLEFTDCGEHQLRGVAGAWRLYRARPAIAG